MISTKRIYKQGKWMGKSVLTEIGCILKKLLIKVIDMNLKIDEVMKICKFDGS